MDFIDFILTALFVFLMLVFVIGFNKQMSERTKAKEERFKKLTKGDKNE